METPPPIPDSKQSSPVEEFQFAHDARVHNGALCRGCGYELTDLHPYGSCPECGKPILQSIRGDLLAYCSAEYLQTLHRGVIAILASIIFNLLAICVSVFAGAAAGFMSGTGANRTGNATAVETTIAAFAVFASIVQTAIGTAGWWWFTEPDLGVGIKDKAEQTRKLVRICAVASGASGILSSAARLITVILSQSTGGNAPSNPALSELFAILLGLAVLAGSIAWIVLFFASMNYMSWLYTRVPDHILRDRSLKYRWVLPLWFIPGFLVCGLGPLIALILYYNHLNTFRISVHRIRTAHGHGTKLFTSEKKLFET